MEASRANSRDGSPHRLNHLAQDVHANSLNSIVVSFDRIQSRENVLGQICVTQLGRPPQNLIALHRHESRDNGNRLERPTLMLPQPLLIPHICVHIVEQLCHDEIRTRLCLLHQRRQIILNRLVFGMRLIRVALRVSCDTNAEVVAILLPDIPHQIHSPCEVLVTIILPRPFNTIVPVLLAPRRIASQGQDVPDTQLLRRLQRLVNQLPRHVGASQVQARGQAERTLGELSKSQRFVARATTSAPGDIDKERTQRVGHALQTGVQVGETLGGFGREEFEGEVVCIGRQGRDFLVDSIHRG